MTSQHLRLRWFSLVRVCLVVLLFGSRPGLARDAGVDAAAAPVLVSVPDPRVAHLDALVAGRLEVGIDPHTLFEVALDDEVALSVDRVRIATLLRTLDEAAGASAKRLPPGVASTRADIEQLDPVAWQARVALDRARIAFYDLPAPRRRQLLEEHAARVAAAKPAETEEERNRREAAEEREHILELARAARSEAERVVAEEAARLLELDHEVTMAEEAIEEGRQQLAARRDAVLLWQRRIRDTKTHGSGGADALYDELRVTLRATRDLQDQALDALADPGSAVPDLGPDPLQHVSPDLSSEQQARRRTEVAEHIERARRGERELRAQRAATLEGVLDTLNAERLDLLPFLSPAKRGAITGFTASGLDQARSETRQLLMILRYHRHVAIDWIHAVRQHDRFAGVPYWRLAAVGVPWLLAALAFGWWRRRSPALLALVEKRLASDDRSERRTQPSWSRRTLSFVRRIHRPLEWLVFFALSVWLVPAGLQALLELQLVGLIVGWSLGGSLIVNVINALSSAVGARVHGAIDSDELRLRSLRLVGRVVVVFALILTISARLVGEGTIYQWVLSTCWLAGLPVFLVLVRWWSITVFERFARARRKTPFQTWILAHRTGWTSFFAATVAAVNLFTLGSYKTVRNWLADFDLTRRGHAYLFRRGLARRATNEESAEVTRLPEAALSSLSPGRLGEHWIPNPADRVVNELEARAAAGRGGVVAVVGARGMGKTTLLRRLSHSGRLASYIDCVREKQVAATPGTSMVMLDDAHALIKPVLGGLAAFDAALTTARAGSLDTLWVFAIDESVWPFLRRARDARPVFDEIFVLESWSDDAIGQLLLRRCAEAGLEPSFEGLLDKLPPAADEVDKQEAIAAKREGYFRMVWDFVRGNPALALEVWRSSLGVDGAGAVRVRSMQSPPADRLEGLPDASLFVLRAVLQMAPASVVDVAQATRLTEAQVENAFRFGQVHGYLTEEAGTVRITWPWLRSVLRILERRHLLVGS